MIRSLQFNLPSIKKVYNEKNDKVLEIKKERNYNLFLLFCDCMNVDLICDKVTSYLDRNDVRSLIKSAIVSYDHVECSFFVDNIRNKKDHAFYMKKEDLSIFKNPIKYKIRRSDGDDFLVPKDIKYLRICDKIKSNFLDTIFVDKILSREKHYFQNLVFFEYKNGLIDCGLIFVLLYLPSLKVINIDDSEITNFSNNYRPEHCVSKIRNVSAQRVKNVDEILYLFENASWINLCGCTFSSFNEGERLDVPFFGVNKLKKLTHLNCDATNIDRLSCLENVTHLSLNNSFRFIETSEMKHLLSIRSLNMHSSFVNSFKFLSYLNLESLNIGNCYLSDEEFDCMIHMKNLTSLNIQLNHDNSDEIFENFSSVKFLSLSTQFHSCSVTTSIFRYLINVEELVIDRVRFFSFQSSDFVYLRNLKKFHFAEIFDLLDNSCVSSMIHLEELTLISVKRVNKINLPFLRELHFLGDSIPEVIGTATVRKIDDEKEIIFLDSYVYKKFSF